MRSSPLALEQWRRHPLLRRSLLLAPLLKRRGRMQIRAARMFRREVAAFRRWGRRQKGANEAWRRLSVARCQGVAREEVDR